MQFQVKLAVTKNWRCFMVALLLVYFVPQPGQAREYQNCEETPHWDMCRYLATQIISGKWAEARKVIEQRKDVINKLLFRGKTFLVFSAGIGSFELVELLLDLGADIEARGSSGRTVLSFAASRADMDMVLMLIERGADVNTVDIAGETPLYHASGVHRPEIMKVLIRNGATAREPGDGNPTTLMNAVYDGDLEVVRLLVEDLGVSVSDKDYAGNTAFLYAVAFCQPKIADYLHSKGAAEQFMNNMGEGYSFDSCPPNRRN